MNSIKDGIKFGIGFGIGYGISKAIVSVVKIKFRTFNITLSDS